MRGVRGRAGTLASIVASLALQLLLVGLAQGAGHETLLKRGWERYQQAVEGKAAWEEALGAFNQAVELSRGEADPLRGVGYVYYQLKWYDEAIDTLRKSLAKNAALPPVKEVVRFKSGVTATIESDAQSTLAWALRFKGRPAEATQEFQKVIARQPGWVDPRTGLGWALYDQGRFADAEREFAAALKVNPQYVDAQDGMTAVQAWRFASYNAALAALGAANYDGAVTALKAVLAEKDRYPQAELWRVWNGLGWAHYYKGQHKEALAAFSEALKQKKDNGEAWKGIGYTNYYGLKQPDEAVGAFKHALALGQVDVQGLLAAAHLAKKDWGAAIAEYQKVTKATPGLADPWIGLAKAQAGKGEDREAQAAYRKAIQIAPAYVMADPEFKKLADGRPGWRSLYEDVGHAYIAGGNVQEALSIFGNLMGSAAQRKGFARIAYLQARWHDAQNELGQVLAGDPADVEAQDLMGWTHFRKGEYDAAIAAFRKVLAKDAKAVSALDGLGWSLYRKGQVADAERDFAGALKIDPQHLDARDGMAAVQAWRFAGYNTALAALGAGNYDGAVSGFKTVLGDKDRYPQAELWRVWNGLGWTHYYKGQHKEALGAFGEALKQKKDNAEAWKGIGYANYYGLKQPDEAAGAFKQALALGQGDVQGLLAAAHLAKKDWATAIAEYQKVTKATPGLADPWIGLAKAHAGKGEDREAQAAYRKAIQIAPAYVMADPEFKKLLTKREWAGLYGDLGWAFLNHGALPQAEAEFKRALVFASGDANVLRGLGYALYRQGKYKDALAGFDGALKQRANDEPGETTWGDVLAAAGWSHYNLGNFDGALKAFQEALHLHRGHDLHADYYSGLGWAFFRKGNRTEARASFEKALRIFPGYAMAYNGLTSLDAERFAQYNVALAALGAANYDGAVSGFKAVLGDKDKRYPEAELWRVWNGLGWAHYYKGQHKEALAAFGEALKQKKDNGEAWKGIGYTNYYGLKQPDEAVGAFKQALALGQVDVQGLLAAAHLAKKDWGAAIAEYQKVTKATPGLADPWIGLAKAQAGKGEDREAQAAYRKAIQIAPAYVMADPEFAKLIEGRRGWEGLYAQVGDALAASGKPTEAVSAYLKLLERVPDSPAARKGLAQVAYSQGKWDDALAHLLRVATKDPGDVEAQTLIGWSHYRKGSFDAAILVFQQIVQKDPKAVEAQDGLGWSLFRRSRHGEAEQHFKEALRQRPGHLSSVEGLALSVSSRK